MGPGSPWPQGTFGISGISPGGFGLRDSLCRREPADDELRAVPLGVQPFSVAQDDAGLDDRVVPLSNLRETGRGLLSSPPAQLRVCALCISLNLLLRDSFFGWSGPSGLGRGAVGNQHIAPIEEGCAVQSHVDESRLHPRHDAQHTAFVNVPDHPC